MGGCTSRGEERSMGVVRSMKEYAIYGGSRSRGVVRSMGEYAIYGEEYKGHEG